MVRLYTGALIAIGGMVILMHSACSGPTDTSAPSALADSTEHPHEWIAMAGADRAELVERALEIARPGWRAAGLDNADVNGAGSLAASFLLSVLWADFEPYKHAVADLGLTFNSDMAEELLELYGDWKLYPELGELEQSGLGVLERFQHVWENPAPRSMAILRFDATGVSAGAGLNIERKQWPYPGWQSQLSMFQRDSGPLTIEEGKKIEHGGKSAFIVFRVELSDGRRGHIRLTMFEDPISNRWLPLDVVTGVEPGESNRAMIPMI